MKSDMKLWKLGVAFLFSPLGAVIVGMDVILALWFGVSTPVGDARQSWLRERAARPAEPGKPEGRAT
jgi:hypothetical protein